jgi:glycosyltransferase involved in cell wall biosynthesis
MEMEITPLILTFNEAPNIGRTLEKLRWAKEIVVMDSFSADETCEIARCEPNVRLVQRAFDNHTAQWNFGIDQCTTSWVLALDADYVLSGELIQELRGKAETLKTDMLKSDGQRTEYGGRKTEDGRRRSWSGDQGGVVAYQARFRYCIQGQPLRGTLYPPRAVLFLKDKCRYEQDGHTQRLRVDGATGWLRGVIDHDDRKPLSQWLWAQERYAALEAQKLLGHSAAKMPLQDRIRRRVVLAPGLVFFYTLLGKGLILDGWAGWYYAFQRTLAEMMLSLRLIEKKLKR